MITTEAKCIECGEIFTLDKLKHVWMEYDLDSLEEGDTEEDYMGLMCNDCVETASELCGLPVVEMQPDEEEIA